jgi:transposase
VQITHARIGSARRDCLHKATTKISQNHAIVCIEDLQIRNLSKSARGNIQAPGQGVRAKSGLNKSILDQSWFEFRRQLAYKLAWNGNADRRAAAPHEPDLSGLWTRGGRKPTQPGQVRVRKLWL